VRREKTLEDMVVYREGATDPQQPAASAPATPEKGSAEGPGA